MLGKLACWNARRVAGLAPGCFGVRGQGWPAGQPPGLGLDELTPFDAGRGRCLPGFLAGTVDGRGRLAPFLGRAGGWGLLMEPSPNDDGQTRQAPGLTRRGLAAHGQIRSARGGRPCSDAVQAPVRAHAKTEVGVQGGEAPETRR